MLILSIDFGSSFPPFLIQLDQAVSTYGTNIYEYRTTIIFRLTMISAQRLLLLRRLANAPKTATKILHHRTISISGSCPTNLAAGRHPSLGRAVHLHASSFATSAAAEGLAAEETKEEDAISEDDKTTFLTTNDETTVTMTTSRTSSEDIEDAPPPMEILSGDFTDTSAPDSNNMNMDENFHGIPPEKIIRTGKIEWIE